MEIKVNGKRYRIQIRHVIECRISTPAGGYVFGEGRSKCHPSDKFNEWTGTRQAIAAALRKTYMARDARASFWEQLLCRRGITAKKPATEAGTTTRITIGGPFKFSSPLPPELFAGVLPEIIHGSHEADISGLAADSLAQDIGHLLQL